MQCGWHLPEGRSIFEDEIFDFRQIRTESGVTPSESRLSVNEEDISRVDAYDTVITNGLWTCQLNGEFGIATSIPVGIYARGGGE